MFSAASIEDNLKSAIDPTIWRRGKQYYAQGAVGACVFEGTSESQITVRAKVRGSHVYHVVVTVDSESSETIVAECDCPYAEGGEMYCKHIAALGCVLVARIRKIFSEYEVYLSADEIAEALQAGRLREVPRTKPIVQSTQPAEPSDQYAGVRARLAEMGFDMSLATNTLLLELSRMMPANSGAGALLVEAPVLQILKDRCAVIVQSGYGTVRIHLYDIQKSNKPWMNVTAAALSKTALQLLLTDTTLSMDDHERAFVMYLSKHDTWSESFDVYQAMALAKDAEIRIYREKFDEKKRMRFVPADAPDLPATLQRKEWEGWHRDGTPRTIRIFELDVPVSLFHKGGISMGKRGMVQVSKNEIVLHSWSSDVFAIISRIKLAASYGRIANASTALTDEEVTRINDIITDLCRCFAVTTDLASDFVITKHENPCQTLLIDYDAAVSRLSIRGAVDYGATLFDVSEEWYANGYAANNLYLTRRTNAKQCPLIVSISANAIDYAAVEPNQEEAVYRTLYEKYGFNKRPALTLSGTKRIERFLGDHWDVLVKLGWKMIFTRDEIKYATSEVRTDMAVDLDVARDWLAFDLTLYCGDERVRLEDVIAFIERGDECLKTLDGRLIRVTNRADLERLVRMLERFSQNASGAFEGRLYNAPEVADVASNSPHYRAKFAKSFDTFMKEARSGKPVRKVVLPKKHRELLRPYQATGVEWMHFLRRYRFGGILADEMGLGKTIQALSYIAMHAEDGTSSLVVCPKTLLHNWQREAQVRFPELSVAVVEGTADDRKRLITQKKNAPHLLITSYPLVQRDIEWYKARKKPFHYLLLDEAQSIKNPRTKNAHAVKAIPADYRIALTGTPLENSVEELWSVFDFLMPGFLGAHASFQKHFGKPIMEHGNANALAHLKAKTSCFMLRRTKSDVLKELPPKIEQTLRVELNDDQNVLYQEVLARTRIELFAEVEKRGFKRAQIHILAALTKLRQICNHPSLVEPKGAYTSAKLDACLDIVREIQAEGRKVLIFSQFTSMLDIIAAELKTQHISFSLLTGKTGKRQELVDAFNADVSQTVFLISLKAGGVGLNLTSADAVIIFDPWWNPAAENQAIDRTHRIGQKKTVNVYRIITTGTIEEKILALQSKKRALFDALVQENSDLFKKLTWDDVQDLFR